MSDYEELVERCVQAALDARPKGQYGIGVRAILAEAFRTLETPTTEMLSAGWPRTKGGLARDAWDAMLRASPLTPK